MSIRSGQTLSIGSDGFFPATICPSFRHLSMEKPVGQHSWIGMVSSIVMSPKENNAKYQTPPRRGKTNTHPEGAKH